MTDLYRDTPVRYLGYANEVGEAFRAHIGTRAVHGTYMIATGYVLADTFDKTTKAYRSTRRIGRTTYTCLDTLTWQMLASVIIPGFTINRLCYYTDKALAYSGRGRSRGLLSSNNRRMLVTAVGLAAIPLIIGPIDHLTDVMLNHTIRKLAP